MSLLGPDVPSLELLPNPRAGSESSAASRQSKRARLEPPSQQSTAHSSRPGSVAGSCGGMTEEDELDGSDEEPCRVGDDGQSMSSNKRKAPTWTGSRTLVERCGLRKGGRLGRLRAMLDQLPLEILAEILSHLPSASLLRLARVAKLFRNLLLSRASSRTIWQAAFRVDGIDGLHCADLSEPAYAAMIWDKECDQCGRKKVHHIHYRLRRRMCDPCLKEWIRRPEDITRLGITLHEHTFKCTPHTTMPPWRGDYLRGQYYLEMSLRATSDKLDKLAQLDKTDPLPPVTTPHPTTPTSPLSPLPGTSPAAAAETPKPEVVAEQLAPTEAVAPTRVANFVASWVGSEGQPGLMELAMEDAETLTAWQAKLEDQRRAQRSGDKSVRAEAIAARLREAGCDELDIAPTLGPFSKVLKEVEQPYKLTDRVWRKIQEPVLAEVERFKHNRLNPHLEQLTHPQSQPGSGSGSAPVPAGTLPISPASQSELLNAALLVEPLVLQQTGMYGNVLLPATAAGRAGGQRHHLLQGQPLVAGRVGGQQGYFVQVQPTAGARIAFARQQQLQQQSQQQQFIRPASEQPSTSNITSSFSSGAAPAAGPSAAAGQYYHQLQLQQAALAARAQQQSRAQQQLLFQQQHRVDTGASSALHSLFGPAGRGARPLQPQPQPQPQASAGPGNGAMYANASAYADLLALAHQQQRQQQQSQAQAQAHPQPGPARSSSQPRPLQPHPQPQPLGQADREAAARAAAASALSALHRAPQLPNPHAQQYEQPYTGAREGRPIFTLAQALYPGQSTTHSVHHPHNQPLLQPAGRALAVELLQDQLRRPASAPPGVE